MDKIIEETEPTTMVENVSDPTDKSSLIDSSDEDSDVFNDDGSKCNTDEHGHLLNSNEIDIHEHNDKSNNTGENERLLDNFRGSGNSFNCNNTRRTNTDDVEMRQTVSRAEDTEIRDPSPRYTKHFHPSDRRLETDRRKWKHLRSVTIESSCCSDTDSNERLSNSTESPRRTASDNTDAESCLMGPQQRDSELVSDSIDDGAVVKRRLSRRRRLFSETKGFSTVTRQFSLFMDKDFRYYFQHPYFRLFLVYFAVVCSYLNYSLDPVSHSVLECSMPLIGNAVAFIGTRYPPGARCVLKVSLWIIGAVSGILIGKYFIHGLIFNKLLRLKMFNNTRGSWMIMMLSSIILIYVCSLMYNAFLMLGGVGMDQYLISSLMGMSNAFFMKFSACASLCGDFFTAWLIVYVMLTETLYPGWAIKTRRLYKSVYKKILSFFLLVAIPAAIFIFLVLTQLTQLDKHVRKFLPSDELSRAFLASLLLVIDLLVIMQDWDFPHFPQPIDVPLSIPILQNEFCVISISGKWFKYGVLFFIMILDLNMWKNQIFYVPYNYGQYIDSDGGIYSVTSSVVLEKADPSTITFEYRNSTLDHWTKKPLILSDVFIYSKFSDFSIGVKLLAFMPSILTLFVYAIFTFKFGRFKPTMEDPYAGRLKKRFRFPLRIPDELRRKIQVVSSFMNFRKSGESYYEGSDDKINTSVSLTDGSGACCVPLTDVSGAC